jgi:hypothetical protein
VATPVPVTPTPVPATPEPVIVKATPTPAPIVVATPLPTPATPVPLDLATVARSPGLWPPQIALVQPAPIPLVINGRAAGQVTLPAGSVLRMRRMSTQQVEVEYQSAWHLVPLTSTDLMTRALATFRANGSVIPEVKVAAATPIPMTVASAVATPAPIATGPAGAVKIGERLQADVVRMKRSRIEGGDFDDKLEKIELKLKLSNTDTKISADKLTAEIYIFGESILDRAATKLLHMQTFQFSLPPRSSHEETTEEVETAYDTTDARFGHKYEGWVLRIKDSTGATIFTKSTTQALLKGVEKNTKLAKNKSYDRSTFKEKTELRIMR